MRNFISIIAIILLALSNLYSFSQSWDFAKLEKIHEPYHYSQLLDSSNIYNFIDIEKNLSDKIKFRIFVLLDKDEVHIKLFNQFNINDSVSDTKIYKLIRIENNNLINSLRKFIVKESNLPDYKSKKYLEGLNYVKRSRNKHWECNIHINNEWIYREKIKLSDTDHIGIITNIMERMRINRILKKIMKIDYIFLTNETFTYPVVNIMIR